MRKAVPPPKPLLALVERLGRDFGEGLETLYKLAKLAFVRKHRNVVLVIYLP